MIKIDNGNNKRITKCKKNIDLILTNVLNSHHGAMNIFYREI